MTSIRSEWNPATGMIRTDLTGMVTSGDVAKWREGLYGELAKVPDGGTFRLLVNLYGFEPVDIDAHKAMRTVVPEILASHGLRPALIDLFEDGPEMELTISKGVRCIAIANVHHDETKMNEYERRIGKPNQRFFTDAMTAEVWLRTYA